jgi:hypothetical protein
MTILMYHQILCFFPQSIDFTKVENIFWKKIYFISDFFKKILKYKLAQYMSKATITKTYCKLFSLSISILSIGCDLLE